MLRDYWHDNIRAEAKHFLQDYICAQQRLRSFCISVQADQSLCCSFEDALNPWLPTKVLAKTGPSAQMCWLNWVFAGCTCCCEGNALPWIILVIPLLHWLDNSASYLQRRRIFFSCFSMKICCRHVLELPNRNSTKVFLLVLIRTVLGFIVQSIARLAEDPGGASLNPSSPT